MNLVKFSNQPSLFDRFFDDNFFDWSTKNFSTTNTTLPAVNIKNDVSSFEIEMAAPGLTKEDFNIEIDNDLLTISCEKKHEEDVEKEKYQRKEFSYLSFSRSFTLPNTVENDKISASYNNGILNIIIPKKEEAIPKPAKKIEIT